MTRRFAPVALLMGCVLLAASYAPAAEDYLKLVPEGALGVVAVNNPAALDAKLQEFGRQMQLPFPGMLVMLDRFGVREGFDEKRAVVLVVLAVEDKYMPTAPLVLVPVTDFDKFIEPFEVEQLADEPVYKVEGHGVMRGSYVRNIGGYAAITDSRHKEVLFEKNLKISKEVPAHLAAWRKWLAGHDAAGVVLRPGVKFISSTAQNGLQKMQSSLGDNEQMKSITSVFDLYGKVLQAAEREVVGWGVGLNLDKQYNVTLTERLLLVPGGKWAGFVEKVRPLRTNLLAGIPDGPLVVAGGCTFSDEITETMTGFSMDLMKNIRELYGLSEEQVGKMSELSKDIKGLRAISMVMQVSQDGEPPCSKMALVMRVDDSRQFMADYEKQLKRYSEFVKSLDNPMFQPLEVEKSEVGGVTTLQMTMKAPQLPDNIQSPSHNNMMKLLFGDENKINAWIVPADKHTVVIGYVNKELLQRTIKAIKQGKPGLTSRSEVKKVAALLPADAVAVGYLSPSGMIGVLKQFIFSIAPSGVNPTFPEFPKTSLVGFAVTTGPNEVKARVVVPIEMIQAGIAGWQKAMIKSRRTLQDEFVP